MIRIRPLLPRDEPFVTSTWSRSIKGTPHAGLICDDDWGRIMPGQLAKILSRMSTLVAYETDAEPGIADLLGWIAFRLDGPPLLGGVYVKESYRRAGLARSLFKAAGIDPRQPFDYVAHTLWCDELADKVPRATFRPERARAKERV